MTARAALEPLVLMVAPLAPHLAEELWRRLGHDTSLAHGPFPVADPQYLVEDTVEYPVQVNGKVAAVTSPPTPTPTRWRLLRWPTRRCRVPQRRHAEEGHRGPGPAGQRRRLWLQRPAELAHVIPSFQIFVMWRILSPSNSMTYT